MKTHPYKQLGESLRARRKALGLTQSEVAERIGKSLNSYHAIESGKSAPRVKTAIALSKVLQWDMGAIQVTAPSGSPILEATVTRTIPRTELPGIGAMKVAFQSIEQATRVCEALGPELIEYLSELRGQEAVAVKQILGLLRNNPTSLQIVLRAARGAASSGRNIPSARRSRAS